MKKFRHKNFVTLIECMCLGSGVERAMKINNWQYCVMESESNINSQLFGGDIYVCEVGKSYELLKRD